MQGYIAREGDRYYAVIYEGLDPITGRERRRWYPGGTSHADAEALAAALAVEHNAGRTGNRSSLTVAVYLTQRWLPSSSPKDGPSAPVAVTPRQSSRSTPSSVAPSMTRCAAACSSRTRLRSPTHQSGDRSPAPPRERGMPSTFLDVTTGHRFGTALWVSANTGMRRGELLGLRWGDIDLDAGRLSVNRSLVSVGYELHESRGKTRTSRRCINLDDRTVDVLRGDREHRIERCPSFDRDDTEAYVFAQPDGRSFHPQLLSDAFKKLVAKSGLPRIRLHDLRHTHATVLLKAGLPIKVVSERLGHSTTGFTMAT